MAVDFARAEQLLNFDVKFDIELLDQLVHVMNTSTGETQNRAQTILSRLKEHRDAWTRVDAILQYSNSLATKYYGLQILETVIVTRWKVLPREQCEGIKNFIVQQVIDISSDPVKMQQQSTYLNKLNLVLIQIVKHEWPRHWPTFISDIVGAAKTSESLCMNNMRILKLLSEEVFDYSAEQMTTAKACRLKERFCTEFQQVFELCTRIMETSGNAALVEVTLETLLRFLNWIPVGYIFETSLLENLVMKFLPVPAFRNVTVLCLVEVAGVPITSGHLDGRTPPEHQKYAEKLLYLFQTAIEQLHSLVPLSVDIATAYANGSDSDQKFISNLAQFLVTFLKEHSDLVEKPDEPINYDVKTFSVEQLKAVNGAGGISSKAIAHAHYIALRYLLRISYVKDVEVFKICLEYWTWLTAELYRANPYHPAVAYVFYASSHQQLPPRLRLYSEHLSELRSIIISNMAKPEEVLVVENEQGEVVRETIKNTDNLALYQSMKETLVFLTHLDTVDTERIMTEKLGRQVNGSEWSWKNLNTLCWAIGSISGAMQQEDEKRFLVTVIRDLLGLCEAKRGKDNKAVIASNIMYVVGQYPRFLREHWKFLKTVVNKLFEFMHEPHEGVQDMAVETFYKITDKCKRHFVQLQVNESTPFIDEILCNLTSTICDLTQPQVHVFYEAVGQIIACENTQEMREVQHNHIEKLMAMPNSVWDDAMQSAAQNVELLRDAGVVKQLANILKTNNAACKSIGQPFLQQLTRIYMDMLNVYKVTSENISQVVAQHGEVVVSQPIIRSMRGLKTDVLSLIACWVEKSTSDDAPMIASMTPFDSITRLPAIVAAEFSQSDPDDFLLKRPASWGPQISSDEILENFVPPLFEAVLFDYQRNVPGAREPEVLHVITVFINKIKTSLAGEIERILNAVFVCTLEMINKDFQEYPEHRIKFFLLLRAITEHCTQGLIGLQAQQFQLYMDSLIWGVRHTMRNVAEVAIETLRRLFEAMMIYPQPEVAHSFYRQYLVSTLVHVLSVVSDSSQSQVVGLTYYAEIIGVLCSIIESRELMPLPLGEDTNVPNIDYVFGVIAQHYKQGFPHLTDDQIRVTIKGFFSYDTNTQKLKEHLRDFLVQVKEQAGEDTTDLYLEETERQMHEAQKAKEKIPGMVNPHLIASME